MKGWIRSGFDDHYCSTECLGSCGRLRSLCGLEIPPDALAEQPTVPCAECARDYRNLTSVDAIDRVFASIGKSS